MIQSDKLSRPIRSGDNLWGFSKNIALIQNTGIHSTKTEHGKTDRISNQSSDKVT